MGKENIFCGIKQYAVFINIMGSKQNNLKNLMQDFDDLQKVLELLEAVSEELYISGVSLNMSHEDFQLDSQI